MQRIDGERKRQGWLHLRVAHGQSRGQNASSDTYIYRKIAPAVRLGGLAPLANNIHVYICTWGVHIYIQSEVNAVPEGAEPETLVLNPQLANHFSLLAYNTRINARVCILHCVHIHLYSGATLLWTHRN